MIKKKMKPPILIRVTYTEDYIMDDPRQIDEWFKEHHPDKYHASRDASKVHGTKKLKKIKIKGSLDKFKKIRSLW